VKELNQRARAVLHRSDVRVNSAPSIVLGVANNGPADGYTLSSNATGVFIRGNDERGLLFGVGRLLRIINATFTEGYEASPTSSLKVESGLSIVSSPDFPIIGHQLGYRPKTNAYDAWTPADYEQYIIDLALFGTNTIELVPHFVTPEGHTTTDDKPYSPHYPVAPLVNYKLVSAVIDKYGLDLSLWYPQMYQDYDDPETVAAAQSEWKLVWQSLSRLDAINIPAGDPGKHTPSTLLKVSKLLLDSARSNGHNGTTIWIGPQEWNTTEMQEWAALVSTKEVGACRESTYNICG
jgi:hypothetical protein